MKILVTGAAGFIGSHLCEFLLEKGYTVTGADNLSTGNLENITLLKKSKNFSFQKADLTEFNTCLDITKNIDLVIHQAALGSVPRSIIDPISTNESNTNGFLNLIIGAQKNNIRRFIYASSSSVYGDDPSLPKTEEIIGNPMSPYAITKRTNELYAHVFAKLYKMQIIGLRYFNVFGPNQNSNGPYAAVIPKFIESLRQLKSPEIYGDGSQRRDFTYVANVIHAIELSMSAFVADGDHKVYNVACGEMCSIQELFLKIRSILGETEKQIQLIEPSYKSKREGEILNSYASIDKIKSELGYQPKVSLADGLRYTISNNITPSRSMSIELK